MKKTLKLSLISCALLSLSTGLRAESLAPGSPYAVLSQEEGFIDYEFYLKDFKEAEPLFECVRVATIEMDKDAQKELKKFAEGLKEHAELTDTKSEEDKSKDSKTDAAMDIMKALMGAGGDMCQAAPGILAALAEQLTNMDKSDESIDESSQSYDACIAIVDEYKAGIRPWLSTTSEYGTNLKLPSPPWNPERINSVLNDFYTELKCDEPAVHEVHYPMYDEFSFCLGNLGGGMGMPFSTTAPTGSTFY